MENGIDLTMATVEKLLNNPFSRQLLKFVCEKDECGNRLELSLKYYATGKIDACWKCKFAGEIVSRIMNRISKSFDIKEEKIKEIVSDPIFRRGVRNVLEGIAKYGVTRPQIVNAPFLVVWDFTHVCNLKCKHCYQRADKPLPDELTTEEAKNLIDQLAEAGTVAIAFSGGEPLLRKDFLEVASYAKSKGFYIAVATNGTFITEEVAKKIKEAVDYVEISLDGPDAETHDNFRGIPGAFNKTIQGIKNCVKNGIYTCIATTVTRHNLKMVPKIKELAENLGVNRIIFFNFIPVGRGINISKDDIRPEEREILLNYILKQNYSGCSLEILSTAPQFARVAVEHEKGIPLGHFYAGKDIKGKIEALAKFLGGCGAGRIYCCVEPNGDVQPCVFMPIKVGNVREKRFLEIWHNSPVLRKLRNRSLLQGACATCEYKEICGGCRARAYAYFNDICAPDPGCINNKEYWESRYLPQIKIKRKLVPATPLNQFQRIPMIPYVEKIANEIKIKFDELSHKLGPLGK